VTGRGYNEWITDEVVAKVGLTETALYDQRGPIGRANQTLLVDRR